MKLLMESWREFLEEEEEGKPWYKKDILPSKSLDSSECVTSEIAQLDHWNDYLNLVAHHLRIWENSGYDVKEFKNPFKRKWWRSIEEPMGKEYENSEDYVSGAESREPYTDVRKMLSDVWGKKSHYTSRSNRHWRKPEVLMPLRQQALDCYIEFKDHLDNFWNKLSDTQKEDLYRMIENGEFVEARQSIIDLPSRRSGEEGSLSLVEPPEEAGKLSFPQGGHLSLKK